MVHGHSAAMILSQLWMDIVSMTCCIHDEMRRDLAGFVIESLQMMGDNVVHLEPFDHGWDDGMMRVRAWCFCMPLNGG